MGDISAVKRWMGLAVLAAVLSAGVSGCGLFSSDTTRPPSPLPEFEPTLKVSEVWSRSVGDGIDDLYLRFYPLVVSDRIYATDHEGRVVALDREDGSRLWTTSLDVNIGAGVNGDDEVVAVGTQDGEVIALNAEDGKVLWRRELSSEVMALSPIDLGILVARTNDSRVYGLEAESGEIVWQSSQTAPLLLLRGQSRPVVDTGRAVIGYDSGKLVALSVVRGNLLWKLTVDVPEGASELERMVDIDGRIRIRDGIIYAVAYQGKIGAVALADGRLLWSREFSSYAGLDVDDDYVYVTDDEGRVWALDRITGGSVWKQDQLTYRQVTAPVVVGDFVVVADFEGYVHWLDKEDGRFVARRRVDSDGVLAAPVARDWRVYVLGNGGTLSVLEPRFGDEG